MDWSYVSGFFDGEGNISVSKISRKGKVISYQVLIRFYNSDLNILNNIKGFLGYGKIYKNNKKTDDRNDLYELTISSKPQVQKVLTILSTYSISKKEKIDYILKNFDFGYNNNSLFNLDEFHSLTSRKNVNKFYVKKEFRSFQQVPCPICGNLFIRSTRRMACSENCRNLLSTQSKTRLTE